MDKLFANSGDPDQTPRSVESDLGLHCLEITLLRVSRLQWVNAQKTDGWTAFSSGYSMIPHGQIRLSSVSVKGFTFWFFVF